MNQTVQMIGLGELLWDCFPHGRLPGGAPANVAFHAQQLGLSAAVATRVGVEELGDELCQFLRSRGLSTDLVQRDSKHHTGTVTIWPASKNNAGYTFLENSAWDFLEPEQELLDAVRSAKAICFGTLGQRRPVSRSTIHHCLRLTSDDCLIVYDVNLRPPFFAKDWILKSIAQSDIVKLNDDEVKVLAKLFEFGSDDEIRFAKGLLDDHPGLRLVCVTRGSRGCLAVTCDEVIELPGIPVEVGDTVGAGDAFTAAIIYGHLQKWSLEASLTLANQFGALVASRVGAMPILTEELAGLKSSLDWSFRDTRVSP
ncbi:MULTISPECIES: carbohydrate kinase family protein [unclassified Schlesneria]|uniref:carbohydrate kinase family protein n=1 Tax=unclassified Schlesneria TaxID=2762017 RepID=UPI002F1D730E